MTALTDSTDQNSPEIPREIPAEISVEISPAKKALLDQIKSMREMFDKAHETSQKAQDNFDAVKQEMYHIEFSSDEEVVKIKAAADVEIYQIQQDLESYKREIETQVHQLRDQISRVYHHAPAIDPTINPMTNEAVASYKSDDQSQDDQNFNA